MLLTSRETAALAADHTVMLPAQVLVQRATTTSDGAGGRTKAWTTIATLTCRIAPDAKGAQEVIAADRLRDAMPYRVAFAAGADVRISDRLVTNGLTLSVEGVVAPRSVEVERVVYATREAS